MASWVNPENVKSIFGRPKTLPDEIPPPPVDDELGGEFEEITHAEAKAAAEAAAKAEAEAAAKAGAEAAAKAEAKAAKAAPVAAAKVELHPSAEALVKYPDVVVKLG